MVFKIGYTTLLMDFSYIREGDISKWYWDAYSVSSKAQQFISFCNSYSRIPSMNLSIHSISRNKNKSKRLECYVPYEGWKTPSSSLALSHCHSPCQSVKEAINEPFPSMRMTIHKCVCLCVCVCVCLCMWWWMVRWWNDCVWYHICSMVSNISNTFLQ